MKTKKETNKEIDKEIYKENIPSSKLDSKNTTRLCMRIPNDLYEKQKQVAKILGISHARLITMSLLTVPIWDISETRKILKPIDLKVESLLNTKYPQDGIQFDVKTGKWAIVLEYESKPGKFYIRTQRYDKKSDASKVWQKYAIEKDKSKTELHKSMAKHVISNGMHNMKNNSFNVNNINIKKELDYINNLDFSNDDNNDDDDDDKIFEDNFLIDED